MTSAEQRSWVEQEYAWLEQHFTGPEFGRAVVKLEIGFFPNALRSDHPPAEWIIQDLCSILQLEPSRIHHSFFEDARDIHGMPIELQGVPSLSYLQTHTEADGTLRFNIQLANSLRRRTRLLFKRCIYELTIARLSTSGLVFDPLAVDHAQRVELAAIFMGFGLILAHGRNEVLLDIDAGWRKTATYRSPLPHSMFARALVVDAQRKGLSELELLKGLPSEIRDDVREAQKPIAPAAAKTFEQLLHQETGALYRDGHRLLKQGEFTPAIQTMLDALELEDRPRQRALLLHNIGYAFTLMGLFKEAIIRLEEALLLNPEQRYAHDNLGFALIMNDELEAGKASLERALKNPGSHPGYGHRNLAVYYWKKGDVKSAEDEFRNAFEARGPVDLLNAFYSHFLYAQGEPEIAALHEDAANEESSGIPEWINNIKTGG